MQAAVLLVGGDAAATPPTDEAAFAAFGLQVERPEPEPFLLWPENDLPVRVFHHMDTQWQVAPAGGVVGLRYEAMPVVLDGLNVEVVRRRDVIAGVRLMERAAIEFINSKP